MPDEIAMVFGRYPTICCLNGTVSGADDIIHLGSVKQNFSKAVAQYTDKPSPFHFDAVAMSGRVLVDAVKALLKHVPPGNDDHVVTALRKAVSDYGSPDETGHLFRFVTNKVLHGPRPDKWLKDEVVPVAIESMQRWCVLRTVPEEGKTFVMALEECLKPIDSDEAQECLERLAGVADEPPP